MWTISRARADSLRDTGGTVGYCATFKLINISISCDINYKDVYSRLNRSKSPPKARK